LKDTAAFLASGAAFVVSNDSGSWQLTGTLSGRCLHGHQLDDVKAMTYHDMKIEEHAGKVTVTYVLDL
jgi:SHS2 domain-containing protein